ncbi:MAG: mannose-6-phosphate isomerase, class I [Actinomycetota bacterium]|nr:mannose-6-phosphate isomerase, class I [Actinomycetota bacterium]
MPPRSVLEIEGVLRNYAWGSTTALPALLGVAPSGDPVAELWLGAHPSAPSPVPPTASTLDAVIATDPGRLLGDWVADRFGGRLPFLLKVLAAERPLSIQVHPTITQARDGYAAEQARGIPADADERNYRDANHKPELLCALTRFTALCGFRAPAETIRVVDAFPERVRRALRDVRADLCQPEEARALRSAFTRLLTLPDPARAALLETVVAGLAAQGDDGLAPEAVVSARIVERCAAEFPGDIGAVLVLLLNPVVLEPGDAIYLGAGVVHCYLHGLGVEIMANSDNVLRCGLTPKHVDVDELLAITDFVAVAEPRRAPASVGLGWTFSTPVPDFRLSLADLDAATGAWGLDGRQPKIVLCTSGALQVDSADGSVGLAPGHAAFVAADAVSVTVRGRGRAFVATVGGELEI